MAVRSKTVELRLKIIFADPVDWTEDNIEQLLNNLDNALAEQVNSKGLAPTWNNGNPDNNEYEEDATYTEDWAFFFGK